MSRPDKQWFRDALAGNVKKGGRTMTAQRIRGRAEAKGVAFLIIIIFVALFACMAVALATTSDMNMLVSRNRLESNQAATLVETGLLLAQKELGGAQIAGTNAEAVHTSIAAHLRSLWASSSTVDAGAIADDAGGVVLPPITLTRADGRTGTISLVITSDGGVDDTPTIEIASTGRFGKAVRTAYYDLGVDSAMFNAYGIVTRSKIVMTDSATIQGANNDREGGILSTTTSVTRAIDMSGSASISGDAAATNPDAEIRTSEDANVGGSKITGAPEPPWPTVQTADFEQYVEEVVVGDVSNTTLHNIRIPAGTNPTFSGNVNLYGVVYIESPNIVTFEGNTNICGIIVAEEPAVENLEINQILFAGNLSASGVQNLPAESRYDGLRDETGSFLLAPGYSAEFSGNFSTIGGCMVAGKFVFRGNAAGTIGGTIINLNDSVVELKGNANLTIDKNAADPHPAGLSEAYALVCVRGSYRE